jgi:hypothetical protein
MDDKYRLRLSSGYGIATMLEMSCNECCDWSGRDAKKTRSPPKNKNEKSGHK